MEKSKCYNLQNNTGEVSLDDLFEMRLFFLKSVEKLHEINSEESTFDCSIEGNGFNIVFPHKDKRFFLRVELDERFS